MKNNIKIIAVLTLMVITGILYSAATPTSKIAKYVNTVQTQINGGLLGTKQEKINGWKYDLNKNPRDRKNVNNIKNEISSAIAALINLLTHTETILDLPLELHKEMIATMAAPLINYLRQTYLLRQYSLSLSTENAFITFSPDSMFIMAAEDKEVKIWNAQTGESISTLTAPAMSIPPQDSERLSLKNIVFNPQNKTQVATFTGNNAYIWNMETKKLMYSLIGHENLITDITFNPDGTYILTGSRDGTAKLWNAQTGELLNTFILAIGRQKPEKITVAFNLDGTLMVTCSSARTTTIWSTHTRESLHTFTFSLPIYQVAFITDEKLFIRSMLATYICDTQGKILHTFDGYNGTLSPDGTTIVTIDTQNRIKASIFNAKTGKRIHILDHNDEGQERCIVFSPDGELIVIVSENFTTLWNVKTGRLIKKLPFDNSRVDNSRVAFSPNQDQLVFSADKKATVYGAPENFIQWIERYATLDQIAFIASELKVPGAAPHGLTKAQVFLLFSTKTRNPDDTLTEGGTGMQDTMDEHFPGLFDWVTNTLHIVRPMKDV